METSKRVRTCLWFDDQGHEAAEFYVSLLPGSAIESVFRRGDDAPPLVVDFHLSGTPYQALNGGPHFKHSPAASIVVMTKDQPETDRLWTALTANGGEESRCGWLVDRYGVSWQIVPEVTLRMIQDPDREAAQRAWDAMLTMNRLDIAAMEAAFQSED